MIEKFQERAIVLKVNVCNFRLANSEPIYYSILLQIEYVLFTSFDSFQL
jgi:hypothetical protein